MRQTSRWLAAAVLIAAAVSADAQLPVPPGAPPKDGEKKDKAQSIEVMTFPSDRDARNMVKAVQDYLREHADNLAKAPWEKICFAAQQVLDAKSDSFFEVTRKDDESGKTQRVSAKAEATRLIGSFPAEGRQFYQLTYGPPADAMLNNAKDAGFDRVVLAEVSQRYFHTRAGATATVLLAGLQLDRGNYVEAAYSYERMLSRPDSDDAWTPRTITKALVAFRRAGGATKESVAKLTTMLEKKFPRDGLAIGRKTYSLDELKEEFDKPFETLVGRVGDAFISMRYGNTSHTSVTDGGRPFLDPTFSMSMLYRTEDLQKEGTPWVKQNLDSVLRGINPAREVVLPGFFPVTTQGLIVYRTYDGVYAVVTKDGFLNHGKPAKLGDLYWIAETKGNLNVLMGGDQKPTAEQWWQQYRDVHNLKSLLYDNPLTGSLAHDGTNVYLVDDAAIPQPPSVYNPEMGFMPGNVPQNVPDSKLFGDGNRLKAVNIETGKLDWELGANVEAAPLTEEQEDKETNPYVLTQGCFFLGPPLPLNGKLYTLVEKNGRIRLLCLDPSRTQAYKVPNRKGDQPDLKAPELVWTQRLGEPNVRLPADANRRFQCSYLAYADGVMVCPTNAGAVVAVDIMSRSLLWARSYRALKPQDPNQNQPQFGGRVRIAGGLPGGVNTGAPISQDRFRAAAPIVSNGRVVFAAFDSESIDCLDLRTGDLMWTEPRRTGDLYVGGLVADRVVVVGKDTVRAVNLIGQKRDKPGTGGKEDAVLSWKDVAIGTPAGHGVGTKGGVYYLPLARTKDSAEPEVWAIDVAKGEVLAKTQYRKREGTDAKPMLGNLVFHDGLLFSQSPTDLTFSPLIDLKKKEMDQRLAANPNDPVGLVARGELNLDDGKLKAAVADLKAAQTNNPPDEVKQRLRDKLYQAYTELLRQDFAAGEGFLTEYRALCDVPADTDDPNLLQKLKDEGLRRKGRYLRLVARGRETQGRLADAFDLYREYASLGDNKELTDNDEPSGPSRPDVWARGRIEMMLRNAKDPAARKPLEERVSKEWESIRGAADLDKLREFVRAFGHHFPAGREGQLALAQKLIATGAEDDAREAQTLLLRLWATADDKSLVARSIETLARLMTRRGLMDDAVGLYAQLGTGYADVVVRDGKTGADFYNDLLTDKRLLPYLEPTRVPMPAKVKATETGAAGGYVPTGFTFEPDGDPSPFVRRHRLGVIQNDGGNGLWSMVMTDRTTGAETWRLRNLKAFAANNGGPSYRLAQASGHLMLLHMGNTVYCLDLAERKTLWEYNVLGDSPGVNPNQPPQMETPADGEVLITYSADGQKMRLGRSAVLAPGAACLLTRDGLVAVDLKPGAPLLWKRTDVNPASLVFGDGRHLFVVEPTSDGKGRSKVFRVADGAAVDNVPDFAAVVTGSGRLRIAGRLVLAAEGGGKKPTVLRLYDPLEGKDVWTREYPADATVLKSPANDLVGMMKADGAFDVVDAATGKVAFAGKLDTKYAAEHVKGLRNPILLAEPDRLFLVLNRDPSGNQGQARMFYSNNQIRTVGVTGAVYAFDRPSGKRLWFSDTLFDNQQLVVERFGDVPALVSMTYVNEDGGGSYSHRIVVADKANGKVRFLKSYPQNQAYFYGIDANPKTGVAKLVGNSKSVEIAPDAATKAESK